MLNVLYWDIGGSWRIVGIINSNLCLTPSDAWADQSWLYFVGILQGTIHLLYLWNHQCTYTFDLKMISFWKATSYAWIFKSTIGSLCKHHILKILWSIAITLRLSYIYRRDFFTPLYYCERWPKCVRKLLYEVYVASKPEPYTLPHQVSFTSKNQSINSRTYIKHFALNQRENSL